MSNWIERLKEEKSELETKIESLDEFMLSSDCHDPEPTDVSLMEEQLIAMEDFLDLINSRLERIEANESVCVTETEYVTSSTANADNVNKAKSIFEDAVDEYLDDLIQTQITPNALITLGFKEEYQHSIDGIAGFLYYTLTLNTVEFCSTSLGEDEPLYVMLGHEGQFSIHNLRKLGDLILSLNEL